MLSSVAGLLLVASASLTRAHMVITYPGWRGNNLHANGTLPQDDPNADVVTYSSNGSVTYPWGMQFAYPCGGMPLSTNRTKWPITGGAIAVQPGWFPGHSKAQIFVNVGIQEPGMAAPPNMSHNVVPAFALLGPSDTTYPGQFCLPNVPLPAGYNFKVGDNITIQVVELTKHGAALYTCVDVTLADTHDPELVPATPTNCYNSSNFGFGVMFSTASLTGSAITIAPPAITIILGLALFSIFSIL